MKAKLQGENRFQIDAARYAAYLESPEGRLRSDLAFANLEEILRRFPAGRPVSALDLGGGTGAASVRLARLGFEVTLLDSSAAMLDVAQRTIAASGLTDKITLRTGDAGMLPDLFPGQSFDLVLCHNLLEYVDEPAAVLHGAVGMMRDSSAVLSLLVRSQAGDAVKAALQTGDLAAAERTLDSDWGQESLYGGKVRLFTPEALEETIKDASLTVVARRGVRTISDYLPQQISRSAEYDRIFALERRLGTRAEFLAMARYMQYLVRCTTPASGVR